VQKNAQKSEKIVHLCITPARLESNNAKNFNIFFLQNVRFYQKFAKFSKI